MNKQELIDFESEIEEIYKTGVIRGPIHLRDGNEEHLMRIFRDIKPEDYKFATWANHLEALLSGVPKEKVKERILGGRSMAMNFPEYRFFTSAIVGGICPIGVGLAWAIKQRGGTEKAWMFIGDMTLHCGIAHESIKYSIYNDLPINWVIADNSKSVDSPTSESWNKRDPHNHMTWELVRKYNELSFRYNCRKSLIFYSYKSKYPHSGVGSFISF